MIPLVIQSNTIPLSMLCRQYSVAALYVFGSALTTRFQSESDLDFLVDFQQVPPADYADNFFDFREALARLFQRKIDLVEVQTLKNPYFKQIVEHTKVKIYDGRPSVQMVA